MFVHLVTIQNPDHYLESEYGKKSISNIPRIWFIWQDSNRDDLTRTFVLGYILQYKEIVIFLILLAINMNSSEEESKIDKRTITYIDI